MGISVAAVILKRNWEVCLLQKRGYILKEVVVCALIFFTCRPFFVRADDGKRNSSSEFKGLVEFEIPLKNQNKVFESLIETMVMSFSEKDITTESIQSLEAPSSIDIPRWMAGKIKRATSKIRATSQFSDVHLKRLKFAKPTTTCFEGACTLKVPVLNFDFDFDYELVTEENVTLFSGKKMGVRTGAHAGPLITIRFEVSGNGAIRNQFRLTHPPEIHFPERSMELYLQLTQEEQDHFDQIGRAAIAEKGLTQNRGSYSDEMVEVYVTAVGNAMVKKGIFKDRDSYGKFMVLKLMTEQFLMTSQSSLDFIQKVISESLMPHVFQKTNEMIGKLETLDERTMPIPLIDFQNIFDYTKNAEMTSQIVTRVSQGELLSQKEWSQYFARFKENWDFKSLELLESLKSNLIKLKFSNEAVLSHIQVVQSETILRIRQQEQKFIIRPELTMDSHGTRVVIRSDKLGSANIPSSKNVSVDFSSSCDVVTHLAVDSINQWLKAEYKAGLLEGCIQKSGVELCSGNDRRFKGDLIEVASLPSLEWDEASQGYNLKIDRVRRDLRASSWGITSLLGLTKDAVSVRMGFKPQSCDNEFLCLKPTSQFAFLRMNNSTAFAGVVSLIKLVQLPYIVVGNALVLAGSSYLQNSVSEKRFAFPQFAVVEVKSTAERISICSKLK